MKDIVFYYPQGHEAHFEEGHPERPERIEVIRNALVEAGWWEKFPHLEPIAIPEDLLMSIHSPPYLEILQEACQKGVHLDMDTYTTTSSWELAHSTAGGALAIAEAVWRKASKSGLALTRPPGHHATRDRGMGFCLLNNIALAAEYLLTNKSDDFTNADRVAIIDIDLHHGNGTQDIFWDRDDVVYISTHQSPLYPGTGGLKEIGAGNGKGYTVNFPLPPGTGDTGFRVVMEEFILPMLDQFKPDMLLISIGFDPHWRDPLGHLSLTAAGYGELIRSMAVWSELNCSNRMALFLEGGYDLDAGAACLQATVAALLGLEWTDYLGSPPRPEGNSWRTILREAHRIWKI